MKRIIAIAALAVSFAMPVHARTCGFASVMEWQLTQKYGEAVVETRDVEHPDKPGVMITLQIWVNHKTKTWTYTGKAVSDGTMCAYASGKKYNGQEIDDFLKPGTKT